MQTIFNDLMALALQNEATDIHFSLRNDELLVELRTPQGLQRVEQAFDARLFFYIKYQAGIDLSNRLKPQTGSFQWADHERCYPLRFAVMSSIDFETGVLRILNNHPSIHVEAMSFKRHQNDFFRKVIQYHDGMVILTGPTGSGKSTTLYALLEAIVKTKGRRIITLEDPIEVPMKSIVQIQVDEQRGMSYEEGLRQVLRHDPDVIMVGEIRDAQSAKLAIRCALTGHLVLTTLHARDSVGAIARLLELGVSHEELKQTLIAVTSQRLYQLKKRKGRGCIYEILSGTDLQLYLQRGQYSESHSTIRQEIREAVANGWIAKQLVEPDIFE